MQPRWVQIPIRTCHWLVAGLDARESGCGSGSFATSTFSALLDLLLGAMIDVDRLAAPEHLDDLTVGDGVRSTSIGAPAAMVRRRVHLGDQRHQAAAAPTAATEAVAI
jgi:hypothetical protein